MDPIPPWAQGPFELIVHAEEHLLKGEDFDRRIALISFDNSVEVAIATYLSLNPIQRGGKQYEKANVERWLKNYYSKMKFLEQELKTRKLPWMVEKSHIIWAHDHRNEQYHGGTKGTPEKQVLVIIRTAALWIMSMLYNIPTIEKSLEEAIAAKSPPASPVADPKLDRAIDAEHGMVEVAGQPYHTSELLFVIDETMYREIGTTLLPIETSQDKDQE